MIYTCGKCGTMFEQGSDHRDGEPCTPCWQDGWRLDGAGNLYRRTAVDYVADLERCTTVDEVRAFGDQVPMDIRQDDRFARGVAKRLAVIKDKKAA